MLGKRNLLVVCLLVFVNLSVNQTASANYSNLQTIQIYNADKFYRTELYFGLNKGDDQVVSEEDWNKFLEAEVTPRFPDGLTVFEAYGQYKTAAGKIVREPSRVLALFYPKKERQTVSRKIEEIRAAYKKQFDQESVLRLDFRQTVEISF